MSASTSEGLNDCDELPVDGSDTWLGMVLMAASSVVSLRFLYWAVTIVGHRVMR